MPLKITNLSFSAIFSLGAASGLYIAHLTSKPCAVQAGQTSYNQPAAAPEDLKKPDDSLVCQETNSGNMLCWPKDRAPTYDLTCIESKGQTLCFPATNSSAPEPEL